MKKFIGIVGIGLICCLIFVILWKGKNPERNQEEIDEQYQYEPYEPYEDTSFSQAEKNPKGNWVQANEGWRYQYENGSFATDTWVFLDFEM